VKVGVSGRLTPWRELRLKGEGGRNNTGSWKWQGGGGFEGQAWSGTGP